MNANEYQKLAARTIPAEMNQHNMLYHALFGLVSEVGEVHGLFQKTYQGHVLDEGHLMKECSDCLWFIAEFCTAMGWKLGDVMQLNINKLKARYPDGFSTERSLNRAEGDI